MCDALAPRHRVCVAGRADDHPEDWAGTAAATHVQPAMFCWERLPLAVLCLTYFDTAAACFVIDPALPGFGDLRHRWRQAVLP